MRKNLISLFTCFALFFVLAIGVSAETVILEATDLKIIIDGELAEFKDIPIYVSQRTMLPLRELLTKLGVQNDDEHIVWNGAEESVTVYKDDIKLYLKAESKTAYINDVPYELDVGPVGYSKNQRIYIPARFVCEALGSKIAWDGSSNTILIRDAEEYAQIEEILTKSVLAMQEIHKYKLTLDMDISTVQNGLSFQAGVDMTGEIDREKQKMHMNMNMAMLGMEIKADSYYSDMVVYDYIPFTGIWEKKTYSADEFDRIFSDESNMGILEANDLMCTALELAESDNANEIILKGNVYLGELLDAALAGNESTSDLTGNKEYEFSKFIMEIHLDKNSYIINSITQSVNLFEKVDNMNMDLTANIVFSDNNGAFEIIVPDEVKDAAVEKTNTDLQL